MKNRSLFFLIIFGLFSALFLFPFFILAETASNSAILPFGEGYLALETVYMAGWGGIKEDGHSIEAKTELLLPKGGTIKNLYVKSRVGTSDLVATFTVRKNGVDQTLTCAMASGVLTGNDTEHSFVAVAGDVIAVKLVGSGTGGSREETTATMEIVFAEYELGGGDGTTTVEIDLENTENILDLIARTQFWFAGIFLFLFVIYLLWRK